MPFPTAQALVYLPATLRGLHLLPPFPKTFNYVTAQVLHLEAPHGESAP